jgi:Tol biopolymer transport system component
MTVSGGTTLGPYEIISPLGAGGMGEVYRARDARLGRDVAVKLLPASYANDADRLRRFEQEARATSALNHPNILTVFDLGTHDGAPYIVAELLEGRELRAHLDDGPLPVRRAADYARQVAQGLAAAHSKGVVHRDLKPENLFVTADGRVKILDFGLAKLRPQARVGGVDHDAPTQRPLTDPGVVMGTVGYMSPEQVRGAEADHRSDLFSFGAVLYEMLTGRRAFRRDTLAETMTAILKEEPAELSESNAKVSPQLVRIVERCLEKDPERRFQSAHDLAFALEALSGSSVGSNAPATMVGGPTVESPPARSSWRAGLPWAVAVLGLLLAAVAFALPSLRRAPEGPRAVRFSLALPEAVVPHFDVETHSLAISPDGLRLAYVAFYEGQRVLWLRDLAELSARAMPGTEGATSPFWSPDGRHVAFFADGKLKRADVTGKTVQTVCGLSAATDATGTWGRDGTILYSEEFGGAVYRVPAGGGAAALVLEPRGHARRWVHFLPDGRRFLFYRYDEGGNEAGVYAGSLDSQEVTLVAPLAPARVQYVKGGYLLYPRERSLVAQPFDEKTLRLSGEPSVVVERLPYFDKTGWAEFSASETGALAYMTGLPKRRLAWLDRAGREAGQVGQPAEILNARLSPDAQRAALAIGDERAGSGGDLWIHDLARDTRTLFVSGPTDEGNMVWSPDGRRLAYFSCCEGESTFRVKDLSDTGKGQLPVREQHWAGPLDWSQDGRFILYWFGEELWVLPVSAEGAKPYLWMQRVLRVGDARFSPDGRWVAYVTEETGRPEVYVTSFERPGEKWRVSIEGGIAPRWRRDGKELFYASVDWRVMAAPVKAGEKFDAGPPAPLFGVNPLTQDYDVTADGQRFLLVTSAPGTQYLPFAVALNWDADLKR